MGEIGLCVGLVFPVWEEKMCSTCCVGPAPLTMLIFSLLASLMLSCEGILGFHIKCHSDSFVTIVNELSVLWPLISWVST